MQHLADAGVFFSKTPIVKDDLDFDVFIVDPTNFDTLYCDAAKDLALRYLLYSGCIAAFFLLQWTCTLWSGSCKV